MCIVLPNGECGWGITTCTYLKVISLTSRNEYHKYIYFYLIAFIITKQIIYYNNILNIYITIKYITLLSQEVGILLLIIYYTLISYVRRHIFDRTLVDNAHCKMTSSSSKAGCTILVFCSRLNVLSERKQ